MEYEFDYYLPIESNSGNTPLLMNDDSVDPRGTFYIARNQRVPEGHITYLTFSVQVSPNPDLNTDYLDMDSSSVFSKKVYDALKSQSIEGLQLVEVVIRDKKNENHKGFYIANALNVLSSFDKEKTEFKRISELTKAWLNIKKIVLDKNLLAEIPLEKRLFFEAKENPSFMLYHKSVVDIIMSVNPIGVKFTPIEEWRQ